MQKNHVRRIIGHTPNQKETGCLISRVNEFHLEIIERRLNQSGLSVQQKVDIVDKILASLKAREVDGSIKG